MCAALTETINEFLNQDDGFAAAYANNLQVILGPVQGDWHNPLMADAPGTAGSSACR
ncbi:hypothetical protein [Actinoplanes sp. ATCC 53533]|uniref:hypothetical protein n=1 Tax=Actinoplanes sp. ATCC 53533 TaxID=1288362 RepID=UPI0013154923|nr:hypothetical protein [Actinoplanes sp. ATCC 53533]